MLCRVRVEKVFTHPKRTRINNNKRWDIALLKLADRVDLKKYTPACLPESDERFLGDTGFAYGKNTIFRNKSFSITCRVYITILINIATLRR